MVGRVLLGWIEGGNGIDLKNEIPIDLMNGDPNGLIDLDVVA